MNTCLREEIKPGESDTHPYRCDATEGNGLGEATSPFYRHEKRGVNGSVYVGDSAARGGGAAPAGEAGRARGRSTSDLVLGIKQRVADYRRHARRGRWQDHGVNRVSADGSTGRQS